MTYTTSSTGDTEQSADVRALTLLLRILDRQRFIQREIAALYQAVDEAAELLYTAATREPLP